MSEIVELTKEQRQGYFNRAVAGLAGQNWERSLREMGAGQGCAYRGSNGRKCAVGHLIPDELYDPEFDISAPSFTDILSTFGVTTEPESADWGFFNELQRAHDREWGSMPGRLVEFANVYDLDLPPELTSYGGAA